MKERQKNLARKHENFEQYIASLTLDRKRPDVEYFRGDDGIRQAYERLIETGAEFLTIAPVLYSAEEDPLRALRVDLFRKRQGRKIFQRVIAPDTALARRFQSRDAFEYRRTVLIPEAEFSLEFERTVAGSTLVCFNHQDKTACLIKYPELVSTEAASFEALWAKQLSADKTHPPAALPASPIPLKTRMLSAFREFILSKKSVAAMGAFAFVSAVLTLGLYTSNRELNLERMRDAITGIVSTGVLQFDAADIAKIQGPDDITKPEYAELVAVLNLIRRSNPDIRYSYLMRKTDDPNILSFVADADSLRPAEQKDLNQDGKLDGADALSYPGDPYDISAFPEMLSAFDQPYADTAVEEDQWGAFISGAAPVKDASGRTVAILGIDMLATRLDELSAESFTPLYFFLLIFFTFVLVRFCAVNRSLMHEFWLIAKANKAKVSIAILVACFIAVTGAYSSRLLIRHLLTQQTGQRLVDIAVQSVEDFDPSDLSKLRFARDMQTDVYQKVFLSLNEIRNKNPEVKYAYIFRTLDSDLLEFVADADSNFFHDVVSPQGDMPFEVENDASVYPGFVYTDNDDPKKSPLRNSFEKPSHSIITDQWGEVLTACAPLSPYNGEKTLLCLDVSLDESESRLGPSELKDLFNKADTIFSRYINRIFSDLGQTWLFFALLAPLFFSIVHVLDEYCVDEVLEKPWMGVVTSAASSLVAYLAIPAFLPFVDWSTVSVQWILVGLAAGIAIQASQFFYFRALSFSEAGIVAAYWNLIPAILPLASFILFSQVLSLREYTGIAVLIFASTVMCLLDYHFETRNRTFALMTVASLMQVFAYLLMGRLYAEQDYFVSFYAVVTGIVVTGLLPLVANQPRKAFVSAFAKIKPQYKFFVLIEVANILALASAQMAIKLGDPSLVAAVETTVPAFTFLLSIPWLTHTNGSRTALWSNFYPKMAIVVLMAFGVWMLS
jgi:uncharacterized membrane protein